MLFAVNIQPKPSNISWAFNTPLVTLIDIQSPDTTTERVTPWTAIGSHLRWAVIMGGTSVPHLMYPAIVEVPRNRQLCELHKLTVYWPMAASTSLHCHSSLGPALGRLSTAKSTCPHDSTDRPKKLGRTGIVAKCARGKVSRKQLFAVLAAEEQGIIMWNSEIAESSKWAFCTHS